MVELVKCRREESIFKSQFLFRTGKLSDEIYPQNAISFGEKGILLRHLCVVFMHILLASPVAQMVGNPPQSRRPGFNPWVQKIPWRRECLPSPIILPGEFHGQRSLTGYSPWDRRELEITEQLRLSLFFDKKVKALQAPLAKFYFLVSLCL